MQHHPLTFSNFVKKGLTSDEKVIKVVARKVVTSQMWMSFYRYKYRYYELLLLMFYCVFIIIILHMHLNKAVLLEYFL